MSTSHYTSVYSDGKNDNNDKREEEPDLLSERTQPVLRIGEYIEHTTGGVLMVLNTLFLVAPWLSLLYWTQNEDNYWAALEIRAIISFFLFTTITPMVIFIFFFVLMKFRRNNKLAVWSRILTYHCSFWGVLILASSSVMLNEAYKFRCGMYRCNMLKYLSSGFGFLSCITLFIEAYFHYRLYGKHVFCRQSDVHRQSKADLYGYN